MKMNKQFPSLLSPCGLVRIGQTVVTLLLLLLCSVSVSVGAIFNVKTGYGAAGNGTTDDTTSINNAIVAANTAGGTNTVYFPTGTYLVNDLTITGITDVIFDGDGAMVSVLKRKPTSSPQQNRIGTITGGSNLTFQNLGFDANGIERYGGVSTYTVTTILIQKVRCFDSAPVGAQNGYDRYMFVIQGSSNVTIQDTLWEDLQIEVDTCTNVDILRNVVKRPRETAGIGVFALQNGDDANDYLIQDNWIVDPTMTSYGAIGCSLDGVLPGPANCSFTNIQILNNTIIYTTPPVSTDRSPAIRFGVTTSQQTSTGNIFDHITVTGNKIYVNPSVSDTFGLEFIFLHTNWPTVFYDYDNTTVANNTLYYNGLKNIFRIYLDAAKGVNWSETNNVKTAYVTPPTVPNPLDSGTSTIDQTDPAFTFTPSANWTLSTNSNSYGGNHRIATVNGDSVTITFTGTRAQVLGVKVNDSGIASCTLDGVSKPNIDFYNATTLFQQVMYDTGTLSSGAHTIVLTRTASRNASSSGYLIRVDAMIVTAGVPGDTTLDQTNAAFTFTPTANWTLSNNSNSYGGSHRIATVNGDSVSIAFTGTRAKVLGCMVSDSGIASCTLDSVSKPNIDFYSGTTLFQQVMYDTGTIGSGNHAIVLARTASRNASSSGYLIRVDALIVTP